MGRGKGNYDLNHKSESSFGKLLRKYAPLIGQRAVQIRRESCAVSVHWQEQAGGATCSISFRNRCKSSRINGFGAILPSTHTFQAFYPCLPSLYVILSVLLYLLQR